MLLVPDAVRRWMGLYVAPSGSPAGSRPEGAAVTEQKASRANSLIAFESLGEPVWSPRDVSAFAREGFMQNAIVYRCVRMIAEAAGAIPLLLYRGEQEIERHPLLDLMRMPSYDQTGQEFLESWYGFLLVAGNVYVEAVAIGGDVRELHILRPDRMKVIPGADGWPEGYEYCVNGHTARFGSEVVPGIRPVLHTRLFHPLNDHYGMSPIEAAATAIDIHNEASKWNKALLDNSARPSGALVYAAANGHMTGEQFERLKSELENSYQGAAHAGRPLLLEGGLDWKPLSLTPKDMDFIAAKNTAAREIALALGVPPMLLGIPGDNTYSNYQEAQRAFWRGTVLPLVNRMCRAFSLWLAPYDSPAGSRPQGADALPRMSPQDNQLRLEPDLDQVEALNPERDALWKRLEGVSFLSDDEKRAAAGYAALGEGALSKHRPFEIGAKYRPDQPRVPAGTADGGQWTSDGGAGEVQLAQNRGRGSYTAGGYNFEATPAQIMRLSNARNAAEGAVARVREIDPNWRPRPGIYESAEGAIADQLAIEAEASARFNELRRDAIPGTSHNWGVNRLRKELSSRGFGYKRPTRDPGMLLENSATTEQVRIMKRPSKGPSKIEPPQKFFFEYYYRYRERDDSKWGAPVPVPDKTAE